MIDDKLLDNYIKLFRGRGDVYGTDSGGCAKLPLNRGTFERHLNGSERIGVYPIVPINGQASVVWGCSDFDLGLEQSLYQARQLHDALQAGGVTSWIERSRSKGYHVWVFATEPVSSRDYAQYAIGCPSSCRSASHRSKPQTNHTTKTDNTATMFVYLTLIMLTKQHTTNES
jgi:hypothetical protein